MTTSFLPKISSYGNYSNSNYGAHSLQINMGVFVLYYSYETIVAFYDPQFGGTVCSENCWGVTTGKHLNQIEPNKKLRLKRSEFEKQLAFMLDARINEKID